MKTDHHKNPARMLHFEDAAHFNHVLDTDQALQDGIEKLTAQVSDISEEAYVAEFLRLLRNAGLELSEQELRTLLFLRRKTDQILLCRDNNGSSTD